MNTKILTVTVLTLMLSMVEVNAGGLEGLGRELASAARAAGFKRVGVAGLEPAGRGDSGRGRELEELLTQALVNAGKVQVVERALIHKLMSERALSRSGAAEERVAAGALSVADGVVIGGYAPSRYGMVITARLVSPDTGVIIAAGEALVTEVGNALDLAPNLPLRVQNIFPSPSISMEPLDGLISGAASGPCQAADQLIEEVLDLKARYLVLRERKTRGAFDAEPGLGATGPALRARASDKLAYWRAQKRVPALTSEEVRKFVKSDGDAFALSSACGVEGAAQVAAHR